MEMKLHHLKEIEDHVATSHCHHPPLKSLEFRTVYTRLSTWRTRLRQVPCRNLGSRRVRHSQLFL